jgi:hypothetical protein
MSTFARQHRRYLHRRADVRGVSIKELERRTGLARNTIRAALRSEGPPAFRVSERPSKLDPFARALPVLRCTAPSGSSLPLKKGITTPPDKN